MDEHTVQTVDGLRNLASWLRHCAAREPEPGTKQSHAIDAVVCEQAATEIERLYAGCEALKDGKAMQFARIASRLLHEFMLDCNASGAEKAGVTLARGLKDYLTPVERIVGRHEWRDAYLDAYRAANGKVAVIVESAAGWYRIRTDDGYTTGIQYRRKQIEAMTDRLRERAAGLTPCGCG